MQIQTFGCAVGNVAAFAGQGLIFLLSWIQILPCGTLLRAGELHYTHPGVYSLPPPPASHFLPYVGTSHSILDTARGAAQSLD